MTIIQLLNTLFYWCFILACFMILYPTKYLNKSIEDKIFLLKYFPGLISILLLSIITLSEYYSDWTWLSYKIKYPQGVLTIGIILFVAILVAIQYLFLLKTYKNEQKCVNEFHDIVLETIWGDKNTKSTAIDRLESFKERNSSFISNYELNTLLKLYINDFHKLKTEEEKNALKNYVIHYCDNLKNKIDDYIPSPYPGIIAILSLFISIFPYI